MRYSWLFLLLLFPLPFSAQPALPEVFSDGMVLQQNARVAIWGTSYPSAEVRLQCSWHKEALSTRANAQGEFIFWVPTLSAVPIVEQTFEVSDSTGSVAYEKILMGEVWLAGGQSNMAFELKKSTNGDLAVANSDNPYLRFYYTPHVYFPGEKQREEGHWVNSSPSTSARISAVAYHFGQELQKKLGVPVGLILCYKGGTPAESWMSRESLMKNGYESILQNYDKRIKPSYEADYQMFLSDNRAYKEAQKRGEAVGEKPTEPHGWRNPKRPVGLYELMLSPLMPFTVKGFLWYQGEANAARAQEYQRLFPQLIHDWRKDFRAPNAPFLFVQLCGYDHPNYDYPAWAELREAQWLTAQKVENTAMIVSTDVGQIDDIHPLVKKPIGHRLYLAALALAYGEKVVYQGPTYQKMEIAKKKIILHFDHAEGGLSTTDKKAPQGFEICDKSGNFVRANAKIIGSTLEIWNDDIAKPLAVRYGWSNWPTTTLCNQDGLLATPFRTDSYPKTQP